MVFSKSTHTSKRPLIYIGINKRKENTESYFSSSGFFFFASDRISTCSCCFMLHLSLIIVLKENRRRNEVAVRVKQQSFGCSSSLSLSSLILFFFFKSPLPLLFTSQIAHLNAFSASACASLSDPLCASPFILGVYRASFEPLFSLLFFFF